MKTTTGTTFNGPSVTVVVTDTEIVGIDNISNTGNIEASGDNVILAGYIRTAGVMLF